MDIHVPPLLIVLAAAVIAPLLAEATRGIGLSVVVLELLLGVAIGPQGLGWAEISGALPFLSLFGMGYLFFLAGLEIDLYAIRGRPLNLAIFGWLIVFALAWAIGIGMNAAGIVHSWLIVTIALSTTALGVLIPILRDSGAIDTQFGRYVIAAGVIGELAPILAMSLAVSTRHTTVAQSAFTAIFIAVVLVIAWLTAQSRNVPVYLNLLRRTMSQSSQLPVRMAVLLLGTLAVFADNLGVDLALGALAAGMIVGLATRGLNLHALNHKLDGIAFGVFVPVFFITSGMKLDVAAIFKSTAGLALAFLFFAALPLLRIPVALMCRKELGGRRSAALGLYSATTLSLVVALTQVGVENGLMSAAEAAPLIGGAMLSVLLFPLIAMYLTGNTAARTSIYTDERSGL